MQRLPEDCSPVSLASASQRLDELVDVAAILVELERDPAFTARRKLIREAPRT